MAQGMPLISVVITAYNAAMFVSDAVASALAQTYQRTEIIVVNDGSRDGTEKALCRFGDAITLVTQPNGGVSSARNRGARAAAGNWIAFLDADDVWLPNKLERQMQVLERDDGMVYADRFNIGAKGWLPDVQGAIQPPIEGDLFEHLLLVGNTITTSSVLIRSDHFTALEGFREDLDACEDWDLWLRFSAVHPIRVCKEPLVRYRLHEGTLSGDPLRMWRCRKAVVHDGLKLPRSQMLGYRFRRRAQAAMWSTNGWDAGRRGLRARACQAYATAFWFWPFSYAPLLATLRSVAGRV